MSEQDAVVQPGIAPTARPMFHQRSLAMGWLDDRAGTEEGNVSGGRSRVAPGLWAMNDAGWSHPLAAPNPNLISWFHVEASALADDRPLPVQPFLRCAQETTERIGAVRLTAVQVLLPVQGIDASARPPYALVPSMRTPDWFGECDPWARVPVKVRIDGGLDPSIPAVAPQFARRVTPPDQTVFAGGIDEALPLGDFPAPPFDDRFWNGPPLHGMTMSGELAEWSCDAVGWLAATVADAAAHIGIRTPVLFTVVRD
ncbi:hypothetical protein [Streptomyces sp. NPDC002287]